jgi:hypothetical protein
MSHSVSPFLLNDLFFGGFSTLTFKNETKGSHMTVRVSQARVKGDRKRRLPIFFVKISLLGDGEQGYVNAGTIFQETMHYKLPEGVDPNGRIGRAMAFLMKALKNHEVLREQNVTFQHEGKCCSCGMDLTHPESIPVGLGRDCLSRTIRNNPAFGEIFKMNFPDYPFELRL